MNPYDIGKRFSHRRLSMIASALAGHEPLCCDGLGKDARETVCGGNVDALRALDALTHETMGCKATPEMLDYYSMRFLRLVSLA